MTSEKPKATPTDRPEPQSGTRSAQVARTVRELVSSFATTDLADELIHEALSDAGLASLPERADDLRDFVSVELRESVRSALGPEAAEAVVLGLEPMLEVLGNMDRRRSVPPSGGTMPRVTPSRASPSNATRLAMVSADARLAVRVRVALGPSQDLARYASLDELAARGLVHTGVIIDCRTFQQLAGLVTSATSAQTALGRADVLLLFAGVSERSALRSACPAAGVIVCSSRDVEDAELADLLATFVGTK